MKLKLGIFAKIALCIFAIASVVFIIFGTRASFNRESRELLEQTARIKELEFVSNLNGELLLATKMAKSPLISNFMKNTQDEELRQNAISEILSYQEAFKGKNSFFISASDLQYFSDCKYLYTLDITDPANAWFDACLNTPNDYTFMVSYDTALKKTMLWVDAVVRDGKKGIGLIGTGVDLSDFVDMMYNDLDKSCTMFFYNRDEEISGADDTSLLEKKEKIENMVPEMAKINKYPDAKTYFAGQKGCYFITPIPSVDWMMVLFVPYTLQAFLRNAIIPFGITLIVLFAILALFAVQRFLYPLSALNNAVNDISSGNADLTKRLDTKMATISLIKQIENGFNSFIEKLQQIILSVKDSKGEVFDSLSNLRSSINSIVRSINEINTQIDSMDSSFEEQATFSNQTALALNEVSEKITSLNKMILVQNQSVADASSSIEQMIGNINSVNSSVAKLSTSFTELETNALQGVEKQQEVNERIGEIENQSRMLQDANHIISSIASQTNLLAMNAAIEAAHAGEAGKGFSVVADEIRKLSENSSNQSKTIGLQLTAIQSSISNIVVASDESKNVLNSVVSNIHVTNNLVQSIMGAMKEQEIGSKQICDSLLLLQNNSEEVKNASVKTEEKNAEILEETKKLQLSSQIMQKRINEMADFASSIAGEAKSLENVSDGVDKSIEKIGTEIDLFKV